MNTNPKKCTGKFKTREQLENYIISNWVQSSLTITEIAKFSGASANVVNSVLHQNREKVYLLEQIYPETEKFLLVIANQPHYRIPKQEILDDAVNDLLSGINPAMRSVERLVESTYDALEEAWADSGLDYT